MTLPDLFWSLVIASLLLLSGTFLAARVTLFQRLFLPGSILAGLLALLLGPQGLGAVQTSFPNGVFSAQTLQAWRGLPGVLINVVFAALFLGKPIPGLRDIWRKSGPQVAFGQTLAWGQYVVGLTLGILVLTPFFGMSPLAGALIEISFEGGHGTATGMAHTFRELGFPEGADLALGLATLGLVSGILTGTALINWAARQGHIAPANYRMEIPPAGSAPRKPPSDGGGENSSTDPLAVHFGIVGLAIGIGWLLKEALLWVEVRSWGGETGLDLIRHVPLFPLAMIGGLIVQLLVDHMSSNPLIQRRLMNRISGTALDFTIVAALGTLSLSTIRAHLAPFLLLAAGGLLWSVLCMVWLAPRIIPSHWFERGIGDFGQSTGVTVTGLLLMRMADPQNRSGALESFGYKQLLFEPIVGGGLFTAASLPLIARFGAQMMLGVTAVITLFWIVFGWWFFGRRRVR